MSLRLSSLPIATERGKKGRTEEVGRLVERTKDTQRLEWQLPIVIPTNNCSKKQIFGYLISSRRDSIVVSIL